MNFQRMLIEKESPEELGYGTIRFNLSESSVTDMKLHDALAGQDLRSLTLLYTVHQGDASLRQQIAGLYPGQGISAEDILVVPGAAAALFIVHVSLLRGPADHIVVQAPNYGTNIETPAVAIGAECTLVPITMESGFRSCAEDFKGHVKTNTRLISVTSPHNPSGVLQIGLIRGIVEAILPHYPQLFLLADETYRDISSAAVTDPVAASLHDRVISVSSMSKAFGLPGIRIGWIVCKNATLRERFLAAKEQIFITNSVLDEEVAKVFLENHRQLMPAIRLRTETNYYAVKQWMEAHWDVIEWVDPEGAAVTCFPRLRTDIGISDFTSFLKMLLEKYGVLVGPGRWFGMPDNYIRIGFGYPSHEELVGGLAALHAAIEEVKGCLGGSGSPIA